MAALVPACPATYRVAAEAENVARHYRLHLQLMTRRERRFYWQMGLGLVIVALIGFGKALYGVWIAVAG